MRPGQSNPRASPWRMCRCPLPLWWWSVGRWWCPPSSGSQWPQRGHQPVPYWSPTKVKPPIKVHCTHYLYINYLYMYYVDIHGTCLNAKHWMFINLSKHFSFQADRIKKLSIRNVLLQHTARLESLSVLLVALFEWLTNVFWEKITLLKSTLIKVGWKSKVLPISKGS